MNGIKAIWECENSIAGQFWKNGKADFPIYDMHGHMGAHNAIYMKCAEAPEMIAHMKKIGVKRLVFSHHWTLFDPDFGNEKVYEITKKHSDILRMYVGINPHYQALVKRNIENFDSWAPLAVGFKFLADYHGVCVTDKRYAPVMEFANERKLPILFHTWSGSACDGPLPLLELTKRYPDAVYIFGHSFREDWEGCRKIVGETPAKKVFFELTSIPGHCGMIEALVDAVGSKRILYGTDMPWFDEYQGVGGVVSAKISDDAIRDILYRNAENLLGTNW